ncbi:hypothetical protein HYY75_06775, partial [bacterium]|nr:hypothetical protein [bacterium]
MGFSFQSEKLSDAIVFSLNGYVEKDSAKSVRLKVEEMAKKGELLFILDFTNSPIVNSMAIGELYDMVSLYISIPKI